MTLMANTISDIHEIFGIVYMNSCGKQPNYAAMLIDTVFELRVKSLNHSVIELDVNPVPGSLTIVLHNFHVNRAHISL